MSSEYFIYWRVNGADAEAAIAAAHAFQAGLRARYPQLQSCLYRRPGEREGKVTVMETYASTGAWSSAERAAIDTAALQALGPWLQGQRHVETFVRLAA